MISDGYGYMFRVLLGGLGFGAGVYAKVCVNKTCTKALLYLARLALLLCSSLPFPVAYRGDPNSPR